VQLRQVLNLRDRRILGRLGSRILWRRLGRWRSFRRRCLGGLLLVVPCRLPP
jgi:hypothetical protein